VFDDLVPYSMPWQRDRKELLPSNLFLSWVTNPGETVEDRIMDVPADNAERQGYQQPCN
jgi:hypothetical protein